MIQAVHTMANFSQKAYNLKQINIPVLLDITWKSQKKPRWFKYCWSEINLIFPLFKYHLNQFSNNGTSKKNCYYQISGPLIQIWQWVHDKLNERKKEWIWNSLWLKVSVTPHIFARLSDHYLAGLINILQTEAFW